MYSTAYGNKAATVVLYLAPFGRNLRWKFRPVAKGGPGTPRQSKALLTLFLADRTNDRAYATVLASVVVVVCDVMYCG